MNAERLLTHYEQIVDAPDAVGRLRCFILDLAVRGRLVTQDARDAPASELLRRIAKEKARIGLKLDPSPLELSELPFDLPTGWSWSHVGEVCSKTGSGSTPRGGKEVYRETGIPFLRSQNIYDDGLHLDDVAYIDPATHARMTGTRVQPGDLLLNITGGSMGRCCRVPDDFGEANVSQHVAIVRVALKGMEDFLHCLILSPYFQAFIFDEQTGAGRGGLPKNRMDRIVVALPPLAEQHRIVVKVRELMALCDRLEAAQQAREVKRDRLAVASFARLNASNSETFQADARFALDELFALTARPDQIKHFRQTILNLAICGKLVPQVPNDRLASSDHSVGGNGFERPFALPNGWCWSQFNAVAKFENGDRGKNYPNRNEYVEKGVAWINTGHIQPDGSLSVTAMNFITRAKFDSLGGGKIRPGDLLYCLRGATFGKTAFVEPFTEGAIASSLMIVRPGPLLDRRFAYFYLISPFGRSQLMRFDNGTAQPNLSSGNVKKYLVPLPPLAEQQHIVAKVDALMALCDQLETSLTATAATRRRLLDALLAEALAPAGNRELQAAE